MSKLIVNPKTYAGHELETIFFRPILTGPSAEELGIRVLYNMPMPTTVQLWDHSGNVLTPFDKKSAWSGGVKTTHYQKTIPMQRVKAENAFSASDYFSTIFELITNRPDVNMEDLTGTELEAAETELFRKAIAESIRMHLWLGDKGNIFCTPFTGFDGLLNILHNRVPLGEFHYSNNFIDSEFEDDASIADVLDRFINGASPRLKGLYKDGEVAFFVSPKVYRKYEEYLDNNFGGASYLDQQKGRKQLEFRGFPLVEINLEPYISNCDMPDDFILFTDRRNIVLAVNTADIPGSEVRMWYNPDEMENRQRAVFAIGCEIIDDELVSCSLGNLTK